MFASSVSWTIFQVFIALVLVLVFAFKWRFQYWVNRGVEIFNPTIPFGNLPNPYKPHANLGVHMRDIYQKIRSKGLDYGGFYFFNTPLLLVTDLDLIKNILAKDFQYFVNRGTYYNEKDDPISAHLFGIGGIKWRNLRTQLTPLFTTGKMKMMFQTLLDCEKPLCKTMSKFQEKNECVDIKEILARFTIDIIGSCAFGLDCKSFEDENSPFRRHGLKVFTPTTFRRVFNAISSSLPHLSRTLGIRVFEKETSDFFLQLVKEIVDHREKNDIIRDDFMKLFIELKNKKSTSEDYLHDGKTLTIEEVTAQSFVFFLAGFETSSSTMSFALYELARNEEIQEKVRKEIIEVLKRHEGQITYEGLKEMKYMGQVIEETLRMYPPLPVITRETTKDYKVPGKNLVISKGVRVIIPIYAIHTDREYYTNPEVFDPERFTEDNKRERYQYAHIPFGEGPRKCIGLRFGIMQSKVGLTSLIKNYKFTVNTKTQEPIIFTPNFIMTAKGGIWLNAKKIVDDM